MIRKLDRSGVRVVLGVWGGPDQFTDDGTRRGVLLQSHYDDYVEYVVSVVDFLVAQQKLPIWAITIANEPDGGDGNQIPPDGFAYIAHQLAIQLDPYGVQLYGPDTTSAEAAMDYLPQVLADPVIADDLAFVGFHQYAGDPSVKLASDYVHRHRPGLPVVVTEYTSFSFGDLDAGQEASSPLDFTLDIADTVLAHYRLGADAALYWDAVDYLQPGHDAITRWGLLRSPAEDFAPREWYYGLLQILPYLQPGAQVLQTERRGGDDLGLLAIRTVDGHLAVFFVNQKDAPVEVNLQLTGGPTTVPAVFNVTRTDAAAAACAEGAIQLPQGTGRIDLPGRSITTLLSA
jgi:O-glycosyl hydrolase